MKRCPDCNGSIIRMGHKEKPFFCNSCNKWFSDKEVTPKQTNGDRIRTMSDEELAGFFEGYVDCVYCPRHLDNERCMNDDGSCFHTWLSWLKQEASDAEP